MNPNSVFGFQNGVRLSPRLLGTVILMTYRPVSGDQNIARSLKEFKEKLVLLGVYYTFGFERIEL